VESCGTLELRARENRGSAAVGVVDVDAGAGAAVDEAGTVAAVVAEAAADGDVTVDGLKESLQVLVADRDVPDSTLASVRPAT
jgi:hypothetical protein